MELLAFWLVVSSVGTRALEYRGSIEEPLSVRFRIMVVSTASVRVWEPTLLQEMLWFRVCFGVSVSFVCFTIIWLSSFSLICFCLKRYSLRAVMSCKLKGLRIPV